MRRMRTAVRIAVRRHIRGGEGTPIGDFVDGIYNTARSALDVPPYLLMSGPFGIAATGIATILRKLRGEGRRTAVRPVRRHRNGRKPR